MSTHHNSTLFDAPNSAEPVPKHFSIDLSLELERQLQMESAPVTPAYDTEDMQQKHEALDPEILAHLVMQLRQSLSEMTKERDALAKLLAASHNKEATLNDALQLMTEKATEINEELDAARRKNKEDEEAISLLRAKVEESRRGLMRLQTENRRQTMAPIDINRASLLTNPTANKRASFTPLTGRSNAHRRISSVSDVAFSFADLQPSPSGQTLMFPDTGNAAQNRDSPPNSSARFPGVFGPDVEDIRREVHRLKAELEMTKNELEEANEAREASETCVKALRQFIAENSVGDTQPSAVPASSIKLPLPPTMTTGEESDTNGKKPLATGWGFRLWGGEPPRGPSTAVPQSAPAFSPQLGGTTPIAPLTRLGGLFSSRSSISSTNSGPLPPLQTNASMMHRHSSRETASSDASSVTEPISPSDDIHGLGTGPMIIRDSANFSDAGSIHGVVHAKSLDVEVIR